MLRSRTPIGSSEPRHAALSPTGITASSSRRWMEKGCVKWWRKTIAFVLHVFFISPPNGKGTILLHEHPASALSWREHDVRAHPDGVLQMGLLKWELETCNLHCLSPGCILQACKLHGGCHKLQFAKRGVKKINETLHFAKLKAILQTLFCKMACG